MDPNLEIPAGDERVHQHVSYTLPAPTTLFDVAPHMHFLGREVKAEARLPNGEIKPLIWIKDWDFNWQGQYSYLEPLRLPAGTKIECDFYFDNSPGNVRNPHSPPQTVRWGERSKDEMAICNFLYTCDTLRDFQRSQLHHYQVRMNNLSAGQPPRPVFIVP